MENQRSERKHDVDDHYISKKKQKTDTQTGLEDFHFWLEILQTPEDD